MLKRIALLIVVMSFPFLFTACGDGNGNPAIPSNERLAGAETGFVEGQVLIGPNCPVERVNEPCEMDAIVYAAHRLAILDSQRMTVKEVPFDSKGNFRTDLQPGSYLAELSPNDIGIVKSEPKPFQVESGVTTILTIEIDTGIR